MERKSFASMDCSVAQCLEAIGEWWSMLIVRDAFHGYARFEDFQRRLGISRNILQQRLEHLCEVGVLAREVYCERPLRHEYRLTEKGRDLWPVLTTMRQWGDRYAAPDGAPVKIMHETCGKQAEALLVCSVCGEPLERDEVQVVVAPGRGPAPVGASHSAPSS